MAALFFSYGKRDSCHVPKWAWILGTLLGTLFHHEAVILIKDDNSDKCRKQLILNGIVMFIGVLRIDFLALTW
mgnify:CR=1 FL=1